MGEGWNLGLGSISWAEHQVFGTCSACTPQWEDSWELSDPFGTAADLVPQTSTVSTYNDDSGNPITPSPVSWHTAPETRAKVISFATPGEPPGMAQPVPPCFRVFLPNGIMEEFGCTPDSLQYYSDPGIPAPGAVFISSWLLDLITDPQGNQIHVTYQQDLEVGANNVSYPRDAVPATVEWDSPGCHNAQASCTGSSWTPLMRVSFGATHTVTHMLGSSCPANGSLRCDDPVDETGNKGVPAPQVQSDFVLNDAAVQVRASGSAGWSTLRDYQFSYDQGVAPSPNPIMDPVSGTPESIAGRLLLTGLQVIGADGATALPARTFGYTSVTEYYEDSLTPPQPSTNCGPSWNTGITPNGHNTCVLWSQSYAGNSYYLTSVSNGQGLSEAFSWLLARNNFHGVVTGSPANPFACGVQATYPCNEADDGSWSRAVLTQRTDSVVRLTQSGQGGSQSSTPVTSTWTYAYQVPYPLPAQECPDCVASLYWGNQDDFDNMDFYNGKFMGFAQASVGFDSGQSGGSVEVHKFLTTEGFGLYDTTQVPCNTHNPCHNDPYSDLANAAHGHEYEVDTYDTDGSTLLKQVKTQWAAACPPPGVPGTPSTIYGNWLGGLVTELDHANPVMVCEVHPAQVDNYTYDGGTTPVHSATAYTYDGLGRVASQTQLAFAGAADASGHGNAATQNGGVTDGEPGLVSGNGDTAMGFDGASSTVTGPTITPLQGDNTRSVELWFSTLSQNQQMLFSSGLGGAGAQVGRDFDILLTKQGGVGGSPPVNTPGLYLSLFFDDVYLPGLNLTDGHPHQVVVTVSGSSVFIYVDGTTPSGVVTSGSGWSGMTAQPFTLPVTPNSGGNPVQIGQATGGTEFFSGTVGQVAVYPTALPAGRVQAHLTAGSGYEAAVAADSPAAYWRLNDVAPAPMPS